MNKYHRIALVEDNADLREELSFLLEEEGFELQDFSEAAPFLKQHKRIPFDVVILDIGLPDSDGFKVAQELVSGKSNIGIIMLTARASLDHRINGLDKGADVYLTKPFEFAELLAHLKALLRRLDLYSSDRRGESRTEDYWQLDPVRQLLLVPDADHSILLTPAECSIVQQLFHSYPAHAPRSRLVESLGEDYLQYDERRLEQIMSRLRKKIQKHSRSSPIKAVRGRGYVFCEPAEMA